MIYRKLIHCHCTHPNPP